MPCHACRRVRTSLLNQELEGDTACPLGDERQYDEAAVVVRKALAWCEHLLMSGQHPQIVLAAGQQVDGHRHHILGRVLERLLVEVVADAGPVTQQMLDGHTLIDQRKILSQQRASRSSELELSALDERHHRRGGDPFGAAGDAEKRVDAVRYAEAAMRQAIGAGERHLVPPVNAHHPGEAGRRGELVDRLTQAGHGLSLCSPGRVPRGSSSRHESWLGVRTR